MLEFLNCMESPLPLSDDAVTEGKKSMIPTKDSLLSAIIVDALKSLFHEMSLSYIDKSTTYSKKSTPFSSDKKSMSTRVLVNYQA